MGQEVPSPPKPLASDRQEVKLNCALPPRARARRSYYLDGMCERKLAVCVFHPLRLIRFGVLWGKFVFEIRSGDSSAI